MMGNIITFCFADDEGHDTPLYIKAFNGDPEAVRDLLAAGVDVNQANEEGKTPLYEAAAHGHRVVVEVLLAANADLNQSSHDGYTPLHRAVGRWDNYYAQSTVEVVRALLAKGADTEVADTVQATPLYTAIDNMYLPQIGQRLRVVQALVESGADVNRLNPNKDQTPLIAAIRNGGLYGGVGEALAIVKILLDAKADPNQANQQGNTPLYEAATKDYQEIIETLIDHDAELDKRTLEDFPQLVASLAARKAGNNLPVAALTEKMAATPDKPDLVGSVASAAVAGSASSSTKQMVIKGCQQGRPSTPL